MTAGTTSSPFYGEHDQGTPLGLAHAQDARIRNDVFQKASGFLNRSNESVQ